MHLLALTSGHYFFAITLSVLSIFMVLVILVQRGRGGGLTGALGGMGGQSAFGTKAGDLFTRVTIIVAAVWILLCAASVKYFKPGQDNQFVQNGTPGVTAGAEPGVPNPPPTNPAQSAPAQSAPVAPAPVTPATPAAPAT